MLQEDVYLKDEAIKRIAESKRPVPKKSSKKRNLAVADAGYHFIGFMPIERSVWSLDGLKHHPTRLGQYYT